MFFLFFSGLLSLSLSLSLQPEVVEDFVRNFLVQNGLFKTAECFQSEWYQLAHLGKLQPHHTQALPDVYAQ